MPPLSSCSGATQTVSDTEASSKSRTESPMNENGDIFVVDGDIQDDCDRADVKGTPLDDARTASSAESDNSQVPRLKIVWRNVILFAYLHAAALYGVYLMFTSAKWQTNIFAIVLYLFSGMGVTAGAHRLWAHRSYKARFPLRVFLAFIYTVAFQNSIFEWARDHRVHHKYSETDADPHNAKRGFFFAHIGWLLCRKHPQVIQKGKDIDMGDLMADPVVRFQRKYYLWLVLVCCFVLPTVAPMYLWNESFLNALFVPTLLRFCFTLNQTWLVNSAAHMWGTRPYDIHINPRQNILVVMGAVGEGFHNYHHTFPYDYATSEYGIKYNITTAFIDLMAVFGLAYDLKTASTKTITARKLRTGPDCLQKQGKACDVHGQSNGHAPGSLQKQGIACDVHEQSNGHAPGSLQKRNIACDVHELSNGHAADSLQKLNIACDVYEQSNGHATFQKRFDGQVNGQEQSHLLVNLQKDIRHEDSICNGTAHAKDE